MRVVASVLLLVLTLSATPLNLAIKKVDEDKVKALLKECKDIDLQDKNGNTPLHTAVRIGRLSIIRDILRCKPNIDIKNKRGNTPLSIAIAKNHISSVTLILEYKKNIAKQKKEKPAVYDVIARDDIETFEVLVKKGLDLNTKDKNGVTFLHVAAKHGAKKIVKFLLANGADVKVKDKEYRDALYYALYGRDNEIIEMIRNKIDGQK